MEQPQVEEQKVEKTNQVEQSKEGRKRTRGVERLVKDARENVGAPSNQHMQRRSLDQYTGYMAIMIELVESKPSSFKEVV